MTDKTNKELATEDWIRNRWGGFNYLVIGLNEKFSLDFFGDSLWLDCRSWWYQESECENSLTDSVLLFENATKQNIIDAERIFGIEIKGD